MLLRAIRKISRSQMLTTAYSFVVAVFKSSDESMLTGTRPQHILREVQDGPGMVPIQYWVSNCPAHRTGSPHRQRARRKIRGQNLWHPVPCDCTSGRIHYKRSGK